MAQGLTGSTGTTDPALNDLTDVVISTPADNEVLAYNDATGEWINQTAAEAGLLSGSHNHDSDYISVIGTPAANHFPYQTAGGELTDSGYDAADFSAAAHNHDSAYISVIGSPVENDFPKMTAGGELSPSGYDASDFSAAGHNHDAAYISVIAAPADNHFPYQTATGELDDSGYDAADFAAAAHNHDSAYISVVGTPTEGNFPQLTAGGELVNSTYDETSFATAGHTHAAIALADIDGIGTAATTSGHVLSADGTDYDGRSLADAGIAAAGHSHAAAALNDLSDVTIGAVTAGRVVRADGTDWHDALLSIRDLDVTNIDATPADNEVLAYDSSSSKWINQTAAEAALSTTSHTHTEVFHFCKSGTLTTGTGTFRMYLPYACTLVKCGASVGTAPTGADLIVDVHKDGTTIYTTQSGRPDVAASGNWSGWHNAEVTAFSADSYLTVDIDQVGSTVAGADLTVTIVLTRSA